MWRFDFSTNPGFSRLNERLTGRPGWVGKTALIAAALVVAVPLVMLALAGLFIGVVVFVVLALVAQLIAAVAALFANVTSPNNGRRNVRVIERDGPFHS